MKINYLNLDILIQQEIKINKIKTKIKRKFQKIRKVKNNINFNSNLMRRKKI